VCFGFIALRVQVFNRFRIYRETLSRFSCAASRQQQTEDFIVFGLQSSVTNTVSLMECIFNFFVMARQQIQHGI
jgi:hypothetical protein